ncbi:MAG TPA: hypothetical protein VHC94_13010 [Nitrobacter sp.]|jgi:hypothetical protein|nr:hypothetical protein [Nitrobacter sp.]
MFVRKPSAAGRPDLFVSAKTTVPIPARHPALREALVRASLDPAVRAISHLPSAHVGPAALDLDIVVVERGDGRFRLDVVPARRIRSVADERQFRAAAAELRLPPLVVTAELLRAEPVRANCDLVWSHRGRAVPIDLRMQILRLLVDDGPMALDRLLAGIVGREPAAAVMALACDDLLELDLESGPLGPTTTVRTRT